MDGMSRASTLRSDGLMLNTCSSDALIEVLQHLKRSFWTYPWNTSEADGGGFRSGSAGATWFMYKIRIVNCDRAGGNFGHIDVMVSVVKECSNHAC